MGTSKTLTVFLAYLIGFLVMRGVSASSDFKNLIGKETSVFKCHSIFSGFPEYSGDMLEYMAQLEAVLRISNNKTRLYLKSHKYLKIIPNLIIPR